MTIFTFDTDPTMGGIADLAVPEKSLQAMFRNYLKAERIPIKRFPSNAREAVYRRFLAILGYPRGEDVDLLLLTLCNAITE